MNHTMLNVGSAMNLCARYTAALASSLKGVASILRINSLGSRALSRGLNGIYSPSLSSIIKAEFHRLSILRPATLYTPVDN